LLGHHADTGGQSQDIGKLQFDFLVSRGLRPSHQLVHIGCGSMSTGIHFVRCLDADHYCGMEKERDLVRKGITKELGLALFNAKRPLFIVTDRFAFECCDNRPDFAFAESLFTHLAPISIRLCLENLRTRISDDGVFLATFGEAKTARANPVEAHGHASFFYTRAEMEEFGTSTGWIPTYVGEWGHPRGHMMVSYRPGPAA
jgi:hypothetical protein